MPEPSDPPVREGRIASGTFAYTDEGEGPAVLLIHGLPGSQRDFRWFTPHLLGVRVLRVDQPGFGGTPVSTEPSVDPARRAAFLGATLDALGVDKVVAVGHSFGGLLAAELAAREPERVLGLGLLGSVGTREHRARRTFGPWTSLSNGLRVPLLGRTLLPRVRKAFVAVGFSSSLTDDDLIHTVHRVATADFRRHRHNLAEVRCSTLVAWCEDDAMVEVAIAEDLAARCAPGPRLSWPEGGHSLQKTRAAELGPAVAAWAIELLTR